jgi:hypothetical protein
VGLSATALDNYSFVKWQVDGADYSTSSSTSVTVDANKTVRAFFTEDSSLPSVVPVSVASMPSGRQGVGPSTDTSNFMDVIIKQLENAKAPSYDGTIKLLENVKEPSWDQIIKAFKETKI